MSIGYRPSLVERWHLSPTGSTLSKRLKPGVWAGSIALALLIASATGIPANAQSGSAATDRAALVALYEATDGPNWTNSTNWLSDEPLDSWYGVTTDDSGRVTTLDLAGIGLERSDSPQPPPWDRDLGTPDNLSDPDRDYNEPNRQIPQRIPPELGGLTNLHRLDLSGNHLTGQIPSQLANLANLEHLDLSDNRLTGQIPSEIGNLANLKYLDLSRTGLRPDPFRDRQPRRPGIPGSQPHRTQTDPFRDRQPRQPEIPGPMPQRTQTDPFRDRQPWQPGTPGPRRQRTQTDPFRDRQPRQPERPGPMAQPTQPDPIRDRQPRQPGTPGHPRQPTGRTDSC